MTCISTVNLNKSHNWFNNISQNRIQYWALFLILHKYLAQSILDIEAISFILNSWSQTWRSFQLAFTLEKCGKFSLIFISLKDGTWGSKQNKISDIIKHTILLKNLDGMHLSILLILIILKFSILMILTLIIKTKILLLIVQKRIFLSNVHIY